MVASFSLALILFMFQVVKTRKIVPASAACQTILFIIRLYLQSSGMISPKNRDSIMSKPQSRLLVVFIWLCIWTPVFAQTSWKSGTIIAVLEIGNRFLVAADSLEKRTDNQPPDEKACKITRLGNHAFFSAAGLILADENKLAEKAFSEVTTHDIPIVGERWANVMINAYETFAGPDPNGFASRVIMWRVVNGIFGTNSGGHLAMYDVDVSLCLVPDPNKDDHYLPNFSHYIWGPVDFSSVPLHVYGSGEKNLVVEFLGMDTPRAREARNAMMMRTANSSLGEQQIGALEDAMKFAFQFAPTKDEVGGDVDILELPESGDSHWIKVKPECDDTRKSQNSSH
jgi:hypothetical protein